ncbi:MAG TPA: flagellar hook-basal body complex protein FliE [Oribacterium sp.]|jgi:flagellar hook-basal body complex protein FliE|nr:flagellar hook-basal body complex protein FliE [Oribacterium sp.]
MEINTNQFITPIKSLNSSISALNDPVKDQESQGAQLFKDVFSNAIQNVKDTQADVENKQYLLATGQLDDAHSLPIAEAKAAISLDLMISLRNKAMESYNELIKMNL